MVEIIKKIVFWLLIALVLLILSIYIFILIFAPKILNSAKFLSFVQNELLKKNMKLEAVNYEFKLNKALNTSITADKILIKDLDNNPIFLGDSLKADYNPFSPDLSTISADNLYFDKTKLKKPEKKKEFNPKHKNLPSVNIKNADLILDAENPLKINISNLIGKKTEDKYLITFSSTVNSSKVNFPLKIPDNTSILFKDDTFNFENFEIDINGTPVFVEGLYSLKNKYDLNITSSDLSVAFLEKTFLYFMKQREPNNKNFIENFYDFRGKCDLNLNLKNNFIAGYADLKEFGAKYVKFSIPLYFKTARFNFDNDKITLSEFGTVGEQKAHTVFSAKDIFSKDRLIEGELTTVANSDFAKKYIENLEIVGGVDLRMNYKVYNKEITVDYLASLKKGTSVIYMDSYFVQKDRNRRLKARTFKKGNTMYLENFDYSTVDGETIKNIFVGTGQFDRYDNKYHLNYISCKTADLTPTGIFAFFDKLIKGGYFEGDVKYIAKNKHITGNFSLYDTRYKNFFVKNAKVKASPEKIIINATGEYESEPFSALVDVNNDLYDNIVANNIDLYLKKFEIKKSKKKTKPTDPAKIVNKVKDANITIKKGKVKLDKLQFKDIVLENLELDGSISENMAYFDMPDINFAKGKLSAKGTYDLDCKSSNIDFSANNIDSNLASGMIFNLKNQFEGLANATLSFKSYNNLDIIDATASFSIQDGALTKLGSKEFLVKKSKDSNRVFKFKLTDILNVNEKQIKAFRSNLNGNFDLRNDIVNNLEIFAIHKYLGLYLKGNYNIKSQYADVDIFGNYNKDAQKGIKVLYIPLSWITKVIFNKHDSKNLYVEELTKIPKISGKESDKELFIVKLKGNPNDNSTIKVEMKSLK